jgi:polyferredoxin
MNPTVKKSEPKDLRFPLIMLCAFWMLGFVLWQTSGSVFYLFNFGYIGTAVGLGIGIYTVLPRKKKSIGRRLAQLLVGLYMLGFLGLINKENMQIEGFFFYLLTGFMAGSVIHYAVAKIIGPILFGRGWCAWACWTAMILDYLPFPKNKQGRLSIGWERIRYLHFGISLLLVLILWFYFGYGPGPLRDQELMWLITGNTFYYLSAVGLAFLMKDNRAFCKYLCPITAILKLTSRFSLLKIKGDKNRCTNCGVCVIACPMDINIVEYVTNGYRVLSTECIFCLTCTTACPEDILNDSIGLDIGGIEFLRRRKIR